MCLRDLRLKGLLQTRMGWNCVLVTTDSPVTRTVPGTKSVLNSCLLNDLLKSDEGQEMSSLDQKAGGSNR